MFVVRSCKVVVALLRIFDSYVASVRSDNIKNLELKRPRHPALSKTNFELYAAALCKLAYDGFQGLRSEKPT